MPIGGPNPTPIDSYPATAVAAYCDFLRGGGAEDPDKDDDGSLDLRKERAALVNIQRRIAERELARIEEKYVEVDVVGAHLAAEFTTVKHLIRGLPAAVAPRLALMTTAPEVATYLRKEVDIILTELSSGKNIVEKTLQETRE